MGVFLTALVFIMFVLIPMVKMNEKKYIERKTRDEIILEVKADTNIKKSLPYLIIGFVVLFCLPIGEHGLFITFMKIMTILGLYFTEEELRTKFYMGNNGIYEIHRFKNGSLMSLKRVMSDEIFRITPVANKDLNYKIHYHKLDQKDERTVNIRLEDREDLEILKDGLERTLGLFIEKPKEETERMIETKEKELKIYKRINGWVIKTLVLLAVLIVVKEMFIAEYTSVKTILTGIMALSYIPLVLYLMAMMFARKQFRVLNKSRKDYFVILMITSTLLPVTTIGINGMIEAQRFIIVHIISIGIISALLLATFGASKLVSSLRSQNIGDKMESILNKAYEDGKTKIKS